jgi:hypothetical protein
MYDAEAGYYNERIETTKSFLALLQFLRRPKILGILARDFCQTELAGIAGEADACRAFLSVRARDPAH